MRLSGSILSTRLRTTAVRPRLVRSGLLMCVGSRLLAATSGSIGVNSSALVSLTSVNSTDGSAPNFFSRCSATPTPAKPPPRITTRVSISRSGGDGAYSGPSHRRARSPNPCASNPKDAPYRTQPTSPGNSSRIPSTGHCGCSPASSGAAITLIPVHNGTPKAAAVILLSTYARGVGRKARA